MTSLQQLRQVVRRWGGHVIVVDAACYASLIHTTYDGDAFWEEAPFTNGHALCWVHGVVVCHRADASVAVLVHEVGHVFATTKTPDASVEPDWFGWEWMLARRIGAARTWIIDNANYGIGQGLDFGSLTHAEKYEHLRDSVRDGVMAGIISDGGSPLPQRQPRPIPRRMAKDHPLYLIQRYIK